MFNFGNPNQNPPQDFELEWARHSWPGEDSSLKIDKYDQTIYDIAN